MTDRIIDWEAEGEWINQPKTYHIDSDTNTVSVTTEPETDFWQRTYYGFRNDNAPALLYTTAENFTFTIKTTFAYKAMFDQCGIVIYLDSENWFKSGIEYENEEFSRLGSVVTNQGHSDWATTDIPLTSGEMWYRLSRRGPDFLIESSPTGGSYKQMRVFHLQALGGTTAAMGKVDHPPTLATSPIIRFGPYACSPMKEASFDAVFSDMKFMTPCQWKAHSG